MFHPVDRQFILGDGVGEGRVTVGLDFWMAAAAPVAAETQVGGNV